MTNRDRLRQEDGARLYEEDLAHRLADPDYRAIYEEEAAKKERWLQFVQARDTLGLSLEEVARRLGVSPARVAHIEKRRYDAFTLKTLRRYVGALGGAFRLDVRLLPVEVDRHPRRASV